MIRDHGWRFDRFLHNYFYFVYYQSYVRLVFVLVNAGQRFAPPKVLALIARLVFNRYHSKVLSGGDTRKILTLDRNIHLDAEKNKQVVPFRYATQIIFQEPRHIAVMDCPCKAATGMFSPEGCCIAVGEQLARFWLDHCRKYHARRITQAEALAIVRRYRRRGHVTQAFFKVATGGRTGVICNCCPDCCVSLQATAAARALDPALSMNAPAGYRVIHDSERCTACGHCATVCHFEAVRWENGQRQYRQVRCMGCELCVEQCPRQALTLEIDPDKPLPLDLDRLTRQNQSEGGRQISREGF